MKKILIIIFALTLLPLYSVAQGFTLTVNSSIHADSLHLKMFDGKRDFCDTLSVPFSAKTVLKSKSVLRPGHYQVYADTSLLFDLLISEQKRQSMTVRVNGLEDVVFEDSPENANCLEYNKKSAAYQNQRAALRQEFQDAQKTMQPYMLQTLAEKLMAQDQQIMQEAEAYKRQVMEENAGTLLASIVQFSQEIPLPPEEYYRNRGMLLVYTIEHAFDYYPFADTRMLSTPMVVYRLYEFAANLLYLPPEEAGRYAALLLTQAQADSRTYHFFFEWLQKTFGTIGTAYWNEEIYRAMLKNALAYNGLSQSDRNFYQREMDIYNKNLPGDVAPDFPVLWSDGTKSSLHAVESEYLLLYFQNPDCPTCTEVRGRLAVNDELNRAIASGRLKVVTIYFEDDEALWRRYLQEKANPKYLHGWDFQGEINAKDLYDLRAIPYMFILDKDKKIIKKDIVENEISDALKELKIIE